MAGAQGCASFKGAEINLPAFGNPKTATLSNSNIPMLIINISIEREYASETQDSRNKNLIDNITSQGKDAITIGATVAILIALTAQLFKKKESGVATSVVPVGGGIK